MKSKAKANPAATKAVIKAANRPLEIALSDTRVRRRPCAPSRANQTDRSGTLMLTNDNRADLAVHRVRHPLKFRLLRVKKVHAVNPHLIRVTFTGEDLHDFVSASFDDHIKVFFPEPGADKPVLPEAGPDGPVFPAGQARPIARDFTPRRFDAEARELDIEFAMHEAGPAATWAAQAKVGQYLGIGGPRGSLVIPTG